MYVMHFEKLKKKAWLDVVLYRVVEKVGTLIESDDHFRASTAP